MKRVETEQRNSLPGTARDKRGPDAEEKCVKDTAEETINSSDGGDHDLGAQNWEDVPYHEILQRKWS